MTNDSEAKADVPLRNATEGVSGETCTFQERLLPGLVSWLLVFFMTVSLGIAYGYVYGLTFGMFITALSTVLIFLFMYFSSPLIEVDELVLRVGDARLPRKFIGNPRYLDVDQTLRSRRTLGHRNAYLAMRASIKESIIIEITDVSDPHPYWQFSSRRPKELLSKLEQN
jgi:hypothetical protein